MKKIVYLLFFIISATVFGQQDPQYSLYMFNPLGLNPAYAGSRDALSTGLVYRNQWVSMPGAPKTVGLFAHMPLKNNKMGVGLEITNDQIGPKTKNYITADYAYKIKVGKGKLAFGLRGGIISYNFNWDKVEYKNQQDGMLQYLTASNFTVPTFDFGMYYNTSTFYAGIALSRLTQAEYNLTSQTLTDTASARLYRHFTLTVGKAFKLNDQWVLRPSLLVRSIEGGLGNLDVNFSVLYKQKIWAGFSLRSTNDFVLTLEVYANPKLRIGYAYDYNLGILQTYNGGTHELFIGYDIRFNKTKLSSPRYF